MDSLDLIIFDVGAFLDQFRENRFLRFVGAGWGTTLQELRAPSGF